MSHKHRKALPSEAVISDMADTWAERTSIAEKVKTVPSNLPTEEMRERHGALVLRHVKLSYEEGVAAGRQAARDNHAPLLKQREAVDVAAKHIAIADCGKWETLPEGDERDGHRGFTCRLYFRYLAKSAFRAAGVRWKAGP